MSEYASLRMLPPRNVPVSLVLDRWRMSHDQAYYRMPPCQREDWAWDLRHMSDWIDSVMTFPSGSLPAIYTNRVQEAVPAPPPKKRGRKSGAAAAPVFMMVEHIIDGRHRLETVYRYACDQFAWVSKVDGRRRQWKDLNGQEQQRFLDHELLIATYDNWPEGVIREIFTRLNDGVPLTAGNRFNALRCPVLDAVRALNVVPRLQRALQACGTITDRQREGRRSATMNIVAHMAALVMLPRHQSALSNVALLQEKIAGVAQVSAEEQAMLSDMFAAFVAAFEPPPGSLPAEEDDEVKVQDSVRRLPAPWTPTPLLKNVSEVYSVARHLLGMLRSGKPLADWHLYATFYRARFADLRDAPPAHLNADYFYTFRTSPNTVRNVNRRDTTLRVEFEKWTITGGVPGSSDTVANDDRSEQADAAPKAASDRHDGDEAEAEAEVEVEVEEDEEDEEEVPVPKRRRARRAAAAAALTQIAIDLDDTAMGDETPDAPASQAAPHQALIPASRSSNVYLVAKDRGAEPPRASPAAASAIALVPPVRVGHPKKARRGPNDPLSPTFLDRSAGRMVGTTL